MHGRPSAPRVAAAVSPEQYSMRARQFRYRLAGEPISRLGSSRVGLSLPASAAADRAILMRHLKVIEQALAGDEPGDGIMKHRGEAIT